MKVLYVLILVISVGAIAFVLLGSHIHQLSGKIVVAVAAGFLVSAVIHLAERKRQ